MNKRFFQYGLCLMLLTLCLLLTACGKGGASAPGRAPTEPTPVPTPGPVRFAAGEVAPCDVFGLQLLDVHAVLVALDAFAEGIQAHVFIVHHHLAHLCPWPPVPHLVPELVGIYVAHHRHVVVGSE